MYIEKTNSFFPFLRIGSYKEPVNIAAGLGIVGAGFVSLGWPTPANIIWSVSNLILVHHNYRIGQKAQAKMFSIFAALAIGGIIRYLYQNF